VPFKIILIPLGGRALWEDAPDSWVLPEYRDSVAANNYIFGIGAVAGNKKGGLLVGFL
jgi:hypothetical protein